MNKSNWGKKGYISSYSLWSKNMVFYHMCHIPDEMQSVSLESLTHFMGFFRCLPVDLCSHESSVHLDK